MPQTFQPSPWGWYPVPGKPDDIVKRVEIPELSESLDEMKFMIEMSERATAATGIEKGSGTEREITLGEVKLLTAKAMNRISDISKMKLIRDKALGEMFDKLTEANTDKLDSVKLYKKSAQGNYFEREVSPSDWKSKSGYRCRVTSKAEKDEQNVGQLQKLYAVRPFFLGNPAFDKVVKELALDIAELDQDKKREIMDADAQTPALPVPGAPMNGALPAAPPLPLNANA